jgi:alkanesulfonate monooxygenase SsuD/methylene tetrahydromethanopterin reductase-like flavin-dependent oxidoreductase (luciferase family)
MSNDRLRFGLMLSNRAAVLGYGSARELVDMGVAAEASGCFDSVWSGDAFLVNPRLDAITLLAAVAARTERVMLGPACMGSFTQRGALDLAYGWASLDWLAGGRTVMVACVGGGGGPAWEAEGRATGVAPADRRLWMWERIQLLRRLWSEDRVTFRDASTTLKTLLLPPSLFAGPTPSGPRPT